MGGGGMRMRTTDCRRAFGHRRNRACTSGDGCTFGPLLRPSVSSCDAVDIGARVIEHCEHIGAWVRQHCEHTAEAKASRAKSGQGQEEANHSIATRIFCSA